MEGLSPTTVRMRNAIIALLIGIIVGYVIGYKDAYRGEKAIGSKFRMGMGSMRQLHPDEMRTERQRRANVLRDSIRAKIDSAATLP